MNATKIRQQLHIYLETPDDKKVKALFTMMEDNIKESGLKYTEELKAKLDNGYAQYKRGNAKMVSAVDSKNRMERILMGRKAK
jgi:hypothetical protein